MAGKLIADLLGRRVIFCGGKGGVGKTTISGALGFVAARSGYKVLLVSTDPAHSLGDLLEAELDDQPRAVDAGLWAMELNPERAADAYIAEVTARLREYVKPALYDEIDRQMHLARAAPGAVEAATLERVAGLITQPPGDYDLVIFDTAPTGHTLHLLSLPETMTAWVEGLTAAHDRSRSLAEMFRGFAADRHESEAEQRRARLAGALERRRRLFMDARSRLKDPAHTAFVLITTAERLPVEETCRAFSSLQAAGINVAGLIVNRVLPADVGGEFFRQRRCVEQAYLDEIDQRFPRLPAIQLPLMERDITRSHCLDDLIAGFR